MLSQIRRKKNSPNLGHQGLVQEQAASEGEAPAREAGREAKIRDPGRMILSKR